MKRSARDRQAKQRIAAGQRKHRFGSDHPHLDVFGPSALTPIARKRLITNLRAGLDVDINVFKKPLNQVTPATPVQFGIDLLTERASWYEPARDRLELFDSNLYVRFVVEKPNRPHVVTFAITHEHGTSDFQLIHGPGVPASASEGEGFLQEGIQTTSVKSGGSYLGIVFTPRNGSWWVMLTSITKDFLWRFHSADVTPL